MKIQDVLAVVGRSGYFNKDLAAVRAGGITANGFSIDGDPVTPGFDRVIQPGEVISLMLILEDGSVAHGDCLDVIFTGAAGRDPIFRAREHMAHLEGPIRELLLGRDCSVFKPLAAEVEGLEVGGAMLHTAVRYGVTQALLHAASLAGRECIAETVASEYGTEVSTAPIPILAMCPTDQLKQVDKMVMKGVELLPHGSFSNTREHLGPGGQKLLDYAGWVAGRVADLGAPGYSPIIHLDVYGTLGELFQMDAAAIAGFLGRLKEQVGSLELYMETPIIAETREAQIEAFRALRGALEAQGVDMKLIADEWCNTLDDIQAFADADAVDFIQVKTPDLGGLHNSIEALLYCKAKGMGIYVGGTANETDQSARLCTHIALACRADFMMLKPGQGVDEGLMLQTNEMQRTLALIAGRD